jgi:hypothetical protein
MQDDRDQRVARECYASLDYLVELIEVANLSWEHCYRFFNSRTRNVLLAEKDSAALHLGYLASWGMYRGSSPAALLYGPSRRG